MIHSKRRTPPGRMVVRNGGRKRSPQPCAISSSARASRRASRARTARWRCSLARPALRPHRRRRRRCRWCRRLPGSGRSGFARDPSGTLLISLIRAGSRASSTTKSCLGNSAAFAPFRVESRYSLASSKSPWRPAARNPITVPWGVSRPRASTGDCARLGQWVSLDWQGLCHRDGQRPHDGQHTSPRQA